MKVKTVKLPAIPDLSGEAFDIDYPIFQYSSDGPKILVVTDTIYNDDLEAGAYLSGDTGIIFKNILDRAIQFSKIEPSEVFVVPLIPSVTESPSALVDDINKSLYRILRVIKKQKPDVVIFMGFKYADQVLSNTDFKYDSKVLKNLRGRILNMKLGGRKQKVLFTFSLSNVATMNPKHFGSDVNLIGFTVRDFEQAFIGKNLYKLPKTDQSKWVMVDTIEKFDAFYKKLIKSKTPSIDTEGKNLNRVYGNSLYCVLFTLDGEHVYMVPYLHPKTCFLPKEIEYIKKKLKHYFENGESKYHIYQNAKFDLLMFFSQLGLDYYNHKIYDLMVGEMNLDENRKFFKSVGVKGYALDHIAAQRVGSLDYLHTAISKEDRANMAKFSLEEILEYGGLDVILPYAISNVQIQEAKRRGPAYKNFLKAVTEIGSDKILSFVEMERFGLPVDKDYIVSQLAPDSAINKERQVYIKKLVDLPEVKKTNKILCKQKNIPLEGRGLLRSHSEPPMLFSPKKEEHIQLLFFKVLGLQPLSRNAKGGGKTDKAFLLEYKEKVPAVGIVSEIRNLNVLANTYIKGLLKTIISSEDNKDSRVRAVYDFIRIITGRSGAKNPSLQNIPTHGRLAKIIKRIFCANKFYIMVKTDMSSHEVRLWGMLARDTAMAKAFGIKHRAYRRLRVLLANDVNLDYEFNKFLDDSNWAKIKEADEKRALIKGQSNNPKLQQALQYQLDFEAADLHRVNYSLIYKIDPLDVTKSQRSQFKATVFGAIYERSARTLAITDIFKDKIKPFMWKLIKKTIDLKDQEKVWEANKEFNKSIKDYVDQTQDIMNVMFNQFKKGSDWLNAVKDQVEKKGFTVSIFGNVRHLWGNMHTNRSVFLKSIRRGPNSRVQGAASDCVFSGARLFRQCLWFTKKFSKIKVIAKQCNAVHDSSELEADILLLPITLYFLEHSYTTLVHRRLKDTYGFDAYIGLETDTEIGPHLGDMEGFNGTEANLLKIVAHSIDWQNKEKGYNLDKQAILKAVRHNWRIVNSYWSKEMSQALNEPDHKPNHTMLITPETVKDLGLITEIKGWMK